MQGVPAEVIGKYTVYSKETAEAMARGCADAYKADIGIDVTGTMGNIDPANSGASLADLETHVARKNERKNQKKIKGRENE